LAAALQWYIPFTLINTACADNCEQQKQLEMENESKRKPTEQHSQ